MIITLAKSAGLCFGVNRALETVYDLSKKRSNVKTLGPITHNPWIVDDLKSKGVQVIESVMQACLDDIVVIRAHGVAANVFTSLEQAKIQFIDATCPFVTKIQKIVRQNSQEGKTVIIAGDKNHPEILGIVGNCIGQAHVVKDANELEKLFFDYQDLVDAQTILVAQTTYNTFLWSECLEITEKLCTNTKIFDTICSATIERQNEAIKLAKSNELMIVIGSNNSSNTQKLKEVCKNFTKTVLIENKQQLTDVEINTYKNVGVTAGASTPAHIIKEVLETMNEMLNHQEEELNFAQLLEQSFEEGTGKLYNGKRVCGIVTTISPNAVYVDIGAKQSGVIPADELTDNPSLSLGDVVSKGDEIDLVVLKVNDQEGIVTLSKKRCDAELGFDIIKQAHEDNQVLDGVITNVVRGGVLVLSNNTKLFIPASQVSDKRIEDLNSVLKSEVKFKVLEVNESKRRALASVKAVMSEARKAKEDEFWSSVEIGKIYKGEVKSITTYGAFVDLGNVDGMIHITELSWSKIKHPSEIVNIGDIVEVYIKDLDVEKRRISLGYKKSNDNPWVIFMNNYKVDDVVNVKIVSYTNYGAFATITEGIDGLIHISQIANQRVEKISEILEIGQEVEVKIIEINPDTRRVSLSMRALLPQEEQKIVKANDEVVAVFGEGDPQISEELAAQAEENATAEETAE